MDRRHFLHNFAHAVAFPSMFSSLSFKHFDFSPGSFLSNTVEEGNILILINLDGGNDGLNTVIPLNQYSNLNKVRPHVILPENSILNLGTRDLGFHPALSGFKSLFDEDRLKIIQSVGYPEPNFSHFRSMDIWQSASDADQYLSSGWMGRYLEDRHPTFPEGYPNENYPHPLSVEIGWQSSLLFTGQTSFTSIVSQNPNRFYEIINEFDNEYPSDKRGEKLKYLQLIAKQSNQYGATLKEAFDKGTETVAYENTALGNQMKIITRLITGGLNTRIYMVQLGGFDTHDQQVDLSDTTKGQHTNLLAELNHAVLTLMQNLDAHNLSDRVLTMTFSEFGRTIISNATEGTDHGTAAPMFFFGNKVDPTILGSNPVIPENARWEDNLEMQFDFRNIYASVINQWLGGDTSTSSNVLFKQFPEVQIIGTLIADGDGDGVKDENDLCNDTPANTMVDVNGCALFSLPASNYSILTKTTTCVGSNNGSLLIGVTDTNYVYKLSIPETGSEYEISAATVNTLEIKDLDVGLYTLNFSVEGQDNYLQTFEVNIKEPPALAARASVNYAQRTISVNLSGSKTYLVEINGIQRTVNSQSFSESLKAGNNVIRVHTSMECQGVFEKQVFISEKVEFFPNPVERDLNVVIPGDDTDVFVTVYNKSGNQLLAAKKSIPFSRTISLDFSTFSKNIYIVKVKGTTVDQTFKIIKS